MDWTKPKDPNALPELPAELITETLAIWYEEWRDDQGNAWRYARTRDGKWWKRRSYL